MFEREKPDVYAAFLPSSPSTPVDLDKYRMSSYQLFPSRDGACLVYAHVDDDPVLLGEKLGNSSNAVWFKIAQPEVQTLFGIVRLPSETLKWADSLTRLGNSIEKAQELYPNNKLVVICQMTKTIGKEMMSLFKAKVPAGLSFQSYQANDALYFVIKSAFYNSK